MEPHRIALVEDHALVARGFETLVDGAPDLSLIAIVGTVDELVDVDPPPALVVLDLRLADGSDPATNVAALHRLGAYVLIHTGAEDRALVQSAARSGALGLVRKSSDPGELLAAIRTAVRGDAVFNADWAAAIDADAALADARLTEREQEVLSMYASGETAVSVAVALGISRTTVADYVKSIRRKYEAVGRAAASRVDLYRRAIEDGILE
ncbi:response regulator transcription factor [Demequina sp. NBRC 110053]|uniref:response regulator transcription factor n=1 Tax=Demequina sp. NBRC 110053 TaxID=1570342 RepID=UPI00190EFEC2|nr:response regulator transcription factor [Demequina sp. NBRC 110053]